MADGLTSLNSLSWGTSTGGAAGSAESTLTLGVDRADTRTPPDTNHVWGAQINQVKNLLLLMTATFKGGTRLGVATQSSNPFGASESGFYIDNSGGGWLVFNGTPTAIGGSAATGNWSFSGNTATITGGYTLTGGAASTVTTSSGNLTLSAAGTVLVQTTSGAVSIGNTAGILTVRGGSTSSLDMSAGNGVFKTTTGAHTFGGASWAIPANTVITGSSSPTNTIGISLAPAVTDGASSVAVDINNGAALSTTGWKALRLRNNGTEFAGFGGSQFAAGGVRINADGSAFLDMSLNGATNIGYGSNYIGIGSGSTIFNGQGPRSDGTTTLGASGSPWPAAFISRPVITFQNFPNAASVTINPANGNYARINLGATNVASVTINAGQNGEVMWVEIVEDASGSRSLASTWTNVSFNAGSFTPSAGANKHDMLTFIYNSTFAKWVEISRSVGDT